MKFVQSLRSLGRGRFWLLLGLFSLSLLAGCGSGGTDSTADSGEVVIGLTDAEGDFHSYTVDVLSLTLTKANGAVVETLPLNTRIDFAQYTDMTEFLTAATVPEGFYVEAQMRVDYSNAEIWVENSAGEAVLVPTANIRDEAGNPLGEITLSVRLEGRQSLLIVPGVPANLTLDFDLNTSNLVDLSGGDPLLTVQPVLLADVEMAQPKLHRLRGPLAGVDQAEDQFDVIIRPFRHRFLNDRRFGALTVNSHEQTLYEIDGVAYTGSAGLQALDAMPTFTATVILGDLRFNPRRFEAREVYAGSSVPGGVLDVVRGNVVARSGNELTVRGASLIRSDGSVVFRDTLSVQLNDQTRVTKQLSDAAHTTDEISVGQRISAFGNLDQSAGNLTAEQVRMQLTVLRGTRVGVVTIPEIAEPLVVDLHSIDRRSLSLFDFSGTGATAAEDADPDYYEVDTATLDLTSVMDGAPLKVGGFVTPFGTAPMDFEAQTVVDLTDVTAVMRVGYGEGSAYAFSAVAADGLSLDLSDAGSFHHLSRAGVTIDLAGLSVAPTIVPQADDDGCFWIREGETLQLHTSFTAFATDLAERIQSGGLVKGVLATGDYVDQSGVITSRMVIVSLL
jgi:hypothetical protein